ncbi:MAG: hypothetical protein JWN20_2115, partial [Jatrophihabitantaceae bacterium]|nr:hypothetical protein [Jatrophihabitantaceae bacterium]
MSGTATTRDRRVPKPYRRHPVLEVACPYCRAGVGELYRLRQAVGRSGRAYQPHGRRITSAVA